MNGRIRILLLVTSAALVAMISIGAILGQSDEKESIYKKLDIFVEVMSHIRSNYVEPVQTASIFDGALKGMARTLDAESSYLTADEYIHYKEELPKRTAATGIETVKNPINGYAQVVYIRQGSPAEASGVAAGDFIRAIDGISTQELPLVMIELLMAGPEGSTAEFSILRANIRNFLSFEVERKSLPQPHVFWEQKDGIGLISIPEFSLGTLEKVQAACNEFSIAGIRSIILDVRNNIRGDLDEAVHVADLFADSGTLVQLKTRKATTDFTADEFAFDFDVYVLSDESTGRAAEAFVAALSAVDNVTIVGRTTMGMGTVQKKLELEDGSMLNISYAQVIAPGDKVIHGVGVGPEVEVIKNSDDDSSDRILEKALELVRSGAASKVAQAA